MEPQELLSRDIFAHVFSLSDQRFLGKASVVCKAWKKLAHERLWNFREATRFYYTTEDHTGIRLKMESTEIKSICETMWSLANSRLRLASFVFDGVPSDQERIAYDYLTQKGKSNKRYFRPRIESVVLWVVQLFNLSLFPVMLFHQLIFDYFYGVAAEPTTYLHLLSILLFFFLPHFLARVIEWNELHPVFFVFLLFQFVCYAGLADSYGQEITNHHNPVKQFLFLMLVSCEALCKASWVTYFRRFSTKLRYKYYYSTYFFEIGCVPSLLLSANFASYAVIPWSLFIFWGYTTTDHSHGRNAFYPIALGSATGGFLFMQVCKALGITPNFVRVFDPLALYGIFVLIVFILWIDDTVTYGRLPYFDRLKTPWLVVLWVFFHICLFLVNFM